MPSDVAVIGAGTAGLAAYRAATAAGKRAVLIEDGPYGTTCARVGCMPSKLLIAAAEAAHAPDRWAAFGLQLDGAVRIDGRAVMERVKRERDRFVGFVLEGVDAMPAADRIRGRARFIDDRTLQLDDGATITFGSAVIATGSAPAVRRSLRGLGDRLVVNDDVFEWDDLPRVGRHLRPRRHRPRARPGAASAGRARAAVRAQRPHRAASPISRFGPTRTACSPRSSRSIPPPRSARSSATATPSAALPRTRRRRTDGKRRLCDRGDRTRAERAAASASTGRRSRSTQGACRFRPPHDAVRHPPDLHRRRRERRSAAPARSQRRRPHRRSECRAVSRFRGRDCGAPRSPSCSPIRSSRSPGRGMPISCPGASSPASSHSRTRGAAG